jgi:hypothetical protein
MPPKLDVCITADIEFSINSTFQYPDSKRPAGLHSVTRMVDGKSHGLGFILSTLEEHGFRGTFFTEVLNIHYFSYSEIQSVINQIQEENQDIQLHLHPCWCYFKVPNWMEMLRYNPPNDFMSGRSLNEVQRIIQEGIDIFKKLTGYSPLALRTGGFSVDRNVYTAMKNVGILLSSNVGLAYFYPGEKELHLYGGLACIEDVTEVPVLSYQILKIGNRTQKKLLTITGSSWSEIKNLLLSAWRQQVGHIVILTHAHEFSVERETGSATEYSPHSVNQNRFKKLCKFLSENRQLFEVVTFSQRAEEWRKKAPLEFDLLKTPLRSIFFRALENKIFPIVSWY